MDELQKTAAGIVLTAPGGGAALPIRDPLALLVDLLRLKLQQQSDTQSTVMITDAESHSDQLFGLQPVWNLSSARQHEHPRERPDTQPTRRSPGSVHFPGSGILLPDAGTLMKADDAEHREHTHHSAVEQLGSDFTSGTAPANGTTIHYARGGHGPAVVLLHGFPQDWFEWRRLMPRLAEKFTVIAIDLRGVGGSAAPTDGYAAADLAEDVHQLLGTLGVHRAHIVGHDIGGWVAYAFARLHPQSTSTVLIMETPIPGIEPFLHLDIDVPLWHGAFHMIPNLPEALVAGRQAVYFRYFFDVGTNDNSVITDADVEHYANAYGDAEHLRSAFEVYRALPANIMLNAASTTTVDVPLLLVGGEHVFGPVLPALAKNLRAHHGWTDVQVEIIENGRHYLPEERPDEVAELIERHATSR